MSLRLKNSTSSQFPPDGYPFVDAKTGMKFNGWEGNPQSQAVRIAAHRAANPRHYPDGAGQDVNGIIQELFEQKAKKMPWIFVGFADQHPAQPYPNNTATVIVNGEKCSCGNTQFTPIYCATCSGKRITGYKCASCGKQK